MTQPAAKCFKTRAMG